MKPMAFGSLATADDSSSLDSCLVAWGEMVIEAISQRERRSGRSVSMALSLAFLAPDIVEAAVKGTLPPGLGLADLTDLPMDWAEQQERLGLR
jgi:site-specific DNA recombinase